MALTAAQQRLLDLAKNGEPIRCPGPDDRLYVGQECVGTVGLMPALERAGLVKLVGDWTWKIKQ